MNTSNSQERNAQLALEQIRDCERKGFLIIAGEVARSTMRLGIKKLQPETLQALVLAGQYKA